MIRGITYDNTLLLKASGAAVTSSAAGSIIIDTLNGATLNSGVEVPFFGFAAVFDVTAIDVASNDELYEFIIQGSSSATFASTIVNLGSIHVGNAFAGSDVDSTIGRYEIYGSNLLNEVTYRYLRGYWYVAAAGTTPSITFTAFLAPALGQLT